MLYFFDRVLFFFRMQLQMYEKSYSPDSMEGVTELLRCLASTWLSPAAPHKKTACNACCFSKTVTRCSPMLIRQEVFKLSGGGSGKAAFLPNHDPVGRSHIHRIAFLNAECFIESIDIFQGRVYPPFTQGVGVYFGEAADFFGPDILSPQGGVA